MLTTRNGTSAGKLHSGDIPHHKFNRKQTLVDLIHKQRKEGLHMRKPSMQQPLPGLSSSNHHQKTYDQRLHTSCPAARGERTKRWAPQTFWKLGQILVKLPESIIIIIAWDCDSSAKRLLIECFMASRRGGRWAKQPDSPGNYSPGDILGSPEHSTFTMAANAEEKQSEMLLLMHSIIRVIAKRNCCCYR